ncbi:3-deoxy-8-phosphooctulonate synthase [Pseudodesulfovibrio tunisiensis]|uniref:3-deoxy-8-phosphooctulonate synthase n=1 Tax=Pseudodesulfovibrio tunisiensis TaxID=463192 RepID=UPI001FB2B04C|nr:3-deoxy-8-phosphooctulonate synthase [Pseudodesulfovibrio tunisiensis]
MDLYTASKEGPFIIAGPCVIESREIVLETAEALAEIAGGLGLPLIFKSSFDKANRTSVTSYRGPGMEEGLRILEEVRNRTGLPVITDIHVPDQAAIVGKVVDVLQIPAFLCRQTDLLVAAAGTGRIINIKKGQFLAPWDMRNAVRKVRDSGNDRVWLTERGSTYGYNNLVVDFRSIPEMAKFDVPVVFDATHSVQLPGGLGTASGGQRQYVPVLAGAAVAAGANGVFMEVHPDPDKALCDGPNSLALRDVEKVLRRLKALWEISDAG